jgi:hypothetical protein
MVAAMVAMFMQAGLRDAPRPARGGYNAAPQEWSTRSAPEA